jgi:hypothetical protein
MRIPLARRIAPALCAVASAAACSRTPPPALPFDNLFAPPEGRFVHVSSTDTTGGNRDYLAVAAGDSAVLLDVAGPGVIRRLWLTIASRDPNYLRRIAIEMYWDGETNPSVEAPVGDFFGNGFDRRHYAALPMGVSSGGFYCYLPMPFHRRARIVVVNGTGRPIDAFYYNIDLVQLPHLAADAGSFHAWWHREKRPARGVPHLILDARGRGQYIGTSLEAESYSGTLWFLEGDEIWTVDGQFRGKGTGTEDYFNSGWYFDQGPYAGPFHGLVIKEDSLGRIVAYRWHVMDPVPFHDSIRVEIEHGDQSLEPADYATMAYWYQTEPHAPLPPLPPPNDRIVLGIKIPPSAVPRDSLATASRDGGLAFTLTVPRPDRYEVFVYPRGRAAGRPVSYAAQGGTTRAVDIAAEEDGTVLAPVSLGQVASTGTVTVTAAGSGDLRPAAVDVRPVRVWAREWNVVGPFPNRWAPGTEASPAIDSVFGPERTPDLSATYPVVGGAAGWKRASAGRNGVVDLDPLFKPNEAVAAYGLAYLYAPRPTETVLLLGADDAHVLWVNGTRVSARQGRHISRADDVAAPVSLRAGWNTVLIEVADLDGGWAFQLRAADPEGELRWSATPP